LAVAGSQSSLEMFSESFTSGILFDIKYDKPTLNLIVSFFKKTLKTLNFFTNNYQ
jgi:hypothetical protein